MADTPESTNDPELSARAGLMTDVLAAVTATGSVTEMLQRCTDAVVYRLDGATARVWLLDEASGTLEVMASAGLYAGPDDGHARVPVGEFAIGRIAKLRTPQLSNDILTGRENSYPDWARRAGLVAFAGYPLLVQDRLVGVLALFARQPLSDEALDALAAAADAIALVIDRRRRSEELADEHRLLDTLYRLGTAISAELDLQRVVQTVTDAATELTGAQFGAFFYNVIGDQGESYTLYTLSGAPAEAFADFPLPRNTPVFEPTFRGSAVIRLADVQADPRYGQMGPYHGMPPGHLPVRSYLAVPVTTRDGEVLGGLFFGHANVGMFDERAERVVVGIAGHAALAIDNARQYEREHHAALALQQSLLPDALPQVDGLDLAGHYRPGSILADVGGDWYDAVVLPDGRVAVSVGDVVGHDLRAAAAMGQVRTAARAYALDADDPASVLAAVGRFIVAGGRADHFATTIQAWINPSDGTTAIASAGHPPPLVVQPDGTAGFLEVAALPPVGVGIIDPATARRRMLATRLPIGATLILYTDGLVERRGTHLDDSLVELRTLAAGLAGRSAEEACALLLKAVGNDATDDIAILVLRRTR